MSTLGSSTMLDDATEQLDAHDDANRVRTTPPHDDAGDNAVAASHDVAADMPIKAEARNLDFWYGSYQALKNINIKIGRVGGYSEALGIHDLCQSSGIPVWCGGMLESGIGRAHNIALASLIGFTLPGDISASARYFERDIIKPEVTVAPDGTVLVPNKVGLGFDVDLDFVEALTETREYISRKSA